MFRYALTIFVSAFLLFQVQPLIGRFILPWFGGGPSIWTSCMLFFQMLLLGGYLYAHLLCSRLTIRAQALTHLSVLSLSVLLLPVAPNESWKPVAGQSPLVRILLLLLVTVGGPYFVLATTGPLMQKWFSQTSPGKSPYRLYALSNIGSLLALLSYPFVFEPWMKLQQQVWSWTIVYGVFACMAGWCAVRFLRMEPKLNLADSNSPMPVSDTDAAMNVSKGEASAAESTDQPLVRAGKGMMLLWLSLSACGSAMLLATTNQLCIDVATVPFLWVLPLSLYLISFIICFDKPQWYDRRAFGLLLLICCPMAAWGIANGANVDLAKQVLIFSAALFACCMTCHGELVRTRPDPLHLTTFYLMISAGGVLGGLFVALVASNLFSGYWEFHISLIACCVCTLIAWSVQRVWHRAPSMVFWSWASGAVANVVAAISLVWFPHFEALSGVDEVVLFGGAGFLVLVGLIAIGKCSDHTVGVWRWFVTGVLPVAWIVGIGRIRSPDVIDTGLAAILFAIGLSAVVLSGGLLSGLRRLNSDRQIWCIRAMLLIYVCLLLGFAWKHEVISDVQTFALSLTIAGGILMEWAVRSSRSPESPSAGVWFWAPLATLILLLANFLVVTIHSEGDEVVYMTRNFYGVLQVEYEDADDGDEFSMPPSYRLMHGQIQHGFQYDDEYWGRQPTTYYGPESGLGIAIRMANEQSGSDESIRVGVVGLGTGTIATYGHNGDVFRFYEINPEVLALSGQFFTYLQDSAAQTDVVIGDARIVMERELAAGQHQQLNVLAIDAFSSDAIPVHLLTAECGDIYQRHLSKTGILAIHISNRFLNLGPVVRGLAQNLGWHAVQIENSGDDSIGVFSSTWVLLTQDPKIAQLLQQDPNFEPWPDEEEVLLWTDDYSGLWPILSL